MNHDEKNIEIYKKALKINPNDVEFLRKYGNTLSTQGQYTEACIKFYEALKINPKNVDVYRSLINTLLQAHKYEEADSEFKNVLRIMPNSFLTLLKTYCVHLEAKYQETDTINQLDYLVNKYPNNITVFTTYGKVLFLKENYEKALYFYEKSLILVSPVNIGRKFLIEYGETLIKLNRYKEGFLQFEHVLKLKPTSSVIDIYIEELNKLGRFEDVLELQKRNSILIDRFNLESKNFSDEKKSQRLVESLIAINPNSSKNLNRYIEILVKNEDYEKAFRELDKALLIDVNNITTLTIYAKLLLKLKRYDESYSKFIQILEIEPNNTKALIEYGFGLLINKNYSKAFEQLNKVLEIDPKNLEVLNNYGNALLAQGNNVKAFEYFSKSLIHSPLNVIALNHYWKIATVDKENKFFKELDMSFDDIKLKLIKGYNNIGRSLAKKEIYEDSFKNFELSLKVDSKDTITLNSYGVALSRKGDYAKAFQQFKKSLKINPMDKITLNSYGRALSKKGDFKKAFEQYEKSLYIDPINKVALNNYGIALLQSGNYQLAFEQFELSLSIDPNDKLALDSYQDLLLNDREYNMYNSFKSISSTFDINRYINYILHAQDVVKNMNHDESMKILTRINEHKIYGKIFHKLENHINLIRLTFDFIIKKNYSDESNNLAIELKNRTLSIFKKIKKMREIQKNLDSQIENTLANIEKKLTDIGEDIADKINNELSILRIKIDMAQKKGYLNERMFLKLKKQLLTASGIADSLRIIHKSKELEVSDFIISDIFENLDNKMVLKNAILELDIKNSDKVFEGDKNKIKEIVSELIENSIRHNNEKLNINIFSNDIFNPIINEIRRSEKYLYISFIDNGQGIEKDKKEWVFLPTKTTSEEGTGLGLHIIKKALNSMNGFIVENGTYGKGVKFEIFIPYKGR